MNREVVKSIVLSLHCPEAIANSMVYIVFEDGEVCLTKGGELFMQRNLHCQVPGVDQLRGCEPLPADALPMTNIRGHSFIVARGHLEALAASAAIAGPKGYAQWTLDYKRDDPLSLSMLLM